MSTTRTVVKFVVILIAIAAVILHLSKANISIDRTQTDSATTGAVVTRLKETLNFRLGAHLKDDTAPSSDDDIQFNRKEYPATTPFTRMVASGDVDVWIYDAPRDKIVVKTPDGMADLPCPEVIHGELVIHGRDDHKDGHTPQISIFRRGISAIEHRGSGTVYAEHLTGPHLSAITTGSADLNIGGEGQDARLQSTGSGDINVSWLSVSQLTVDLSGSGDVSPNGNWNHFTVTCTGTGDLNADNITPAVITAHVSGSGTSDVGLAQSLTATVHGDGKLTYYGTPDPLTKDLSGKGSIEMKP